MHQSVNHDFSVTISNLSSYLRVLSYPISFCQAFYPSRASHQVHCPCFLTRKFRWMRILNMERDISARGMLLLLEHRRTYPAWHLSRSFRALGHAKRTSLICIILTTSVAGRRVFRGTRASSAHNSTNIGNCSSNWNSSPRGRSLPRQPWPCVQTST